MRFSVWFLLLLSGMCAVLSYPIDGDLLYEDGYFYNPSGVFTFFKISLSFTPHLLSDIWFAFFYNNY